ncbi:MAG: methionine--tRNA ligase subunit beta, partial [Croceivirga sp.]
DFTWKEFQASNNNELVAIIGNFNNRVTVLTHKYFNGVVPEPSAFKTIDEETIAAMKDFPSKLNDSLERYRFREASQELLNLARLGNKYLADEEPWKSIKTDGARTKTVLFVALQIASALAVLSEPFLPFTSEKLKSILGVRSITVDTLWSEISKRQTLIPSGHQINQSELLFRKIEDKEIEIQLQKLEATKKENNAMEENTIIPPQKDTITYDDFSKMDLRVGTILEAEKMPKTDKLMVMKVDTGIDQRTIVSGIAQHFSAEELIGRQVTVLANLAPRKLRGVKSQGMILLAENSNGKLVFINPDESGIQNGDIIS